MPSKRIAISAITPAMLAVVIIAVAAPVDTAALAGNNRVTAIEVGLGGTQ